MKKWQVYSLIVLAVAYVAVRASRSESEPTNPTQEAVAGICSELSTIGDLNVWQLDELRRSALAVVQREYPAGSFTPPDWMIAKLQGLGNNPGVSVLRETYSEISQRLDPVQTSEDFKRGQRVVKDLRGPPKPVNGKCPDCDGTGKVGDGRVFTKCLACGGDGKIDDSDRKEGACDSQTPTQESAGDQKSRQPDGVKSGGGGSFSKRRVYFPVLNRLLGG